MESQDGCWASLNQSDAQGSSSSMQLSRDSFSTSDSHQVDVDLLGGDLALSDDSSEGESEEVDSDSDSEESGGQGLGQYRVGTADGRPQPVLPCPQ